MIKILVDVHGGDNSPEVLIEGAVRACIKNRQLSIILAGDENLIQSTLDRLDYPFERTQILPCNDVVTNDDSPSQVLKTKPTSSLIKGMRCVASSNDIEGFVSVGNTGAILASSMFILGRINKCRPTLSSFLPQSCGRDVLLVDCGANIDCSEDMLLAFAKMGKAYCVALGNENPRIGLLSNGAEEKKGNDLTKKTHALLKNEPSLNFIGNVEGSNCLNDVCDVIVSDGFAGNILLKNIEGLAKSLITNINNEKEKLNDLTSKRDIDEIVAKMTKIYDMNSRGGAVLLGVNKVVVKGHGCANQNTMEAIVTMAYQLAKNKLVDHIKQELNTSIEE
jgi:glycerol-3-phosphate acyltransferase PlsX